MKRTKKLNSGYIYDTRTNDKFQKINITPQGTSNLIKITKFNKLYFFAGQAPTITQHLISL